MHLTDCRVVVTGARGGLGAGIAARLACAGARLCLADIDGGGDESIVAADITRDDDRRRLVAEAHARLGAVDMLVNAAGVNPFGLFHLQGAAAIESVMAVNTLAPMLLAHAFLPEMLARRKGRIVHIGSMLGSIAFGCFSAYSASKFALRGFSQALRRELDGSGVGVTYVAPRAVRTALNADVVYQMADEIGMTFDDPALVADRIVAAIVDDEDELYIGFPESLFARLNGLAPALVDRALRNRHAIMRERARRAAGDPPPDSSRRGP